MARPKTNAAQLSKMRNAILEAATVIFAAQGFAGAGLRQIAKAAGVFTPQVYQLFADKRDLYHQCCERIFLRNSQLVANACNPYPAPADKLRAFTLTLATVMSEDAVLARLFQRQLLEHDQFGIDALTGHHYKDEFDRLVDWIAAVAGPQDASIKAYAIYALTTGLVIHQPLVALSERRLPELDSPDRIANFVLNTMVPEAIGKRVMVHRAAIARSNRSTRANPSKRLTVTSG